MKKNSFNFKEKIMEKELNSLYQYGIEVFGNEDKFSAWLATKNPTLGNIKPKELLDDDAGINLLKDELTRIEYGVLA